MAIPTQFENATVVAVANTYFGGGVVSHTVHAPDGLKRTLGIIRPGSYHFGTAAAERMEITAGSCKVRLDGSSTTTTYAAGSTFEVAANAGFTIAVDEGLCQYICTFLP